MNLNLPAYRNVLSYLIDFLSYNDILKLRLVWKNLNIPKIRPHVDLIRTLMKKCKEKRDKPKNSLGMISKKKLKSLSFPLEGQDVNFEKLKELCKWDRITKGSSVYHSGHNITITDNMVKIDNHTSKNEGDVLFFANKQEEWACVLIRTNILLVKDKVYQDICISQYFDELQTIKCPLTNRCFKYSISKIYEIFQDRIFIRPPSKNILAMFGDLLFIQHSNKKIEVTKMEDSTITYKPHLSFG